MKHLVELHGGTVAAQSPGPGLGATFVVTLPLTVAQISVEGCGRVHPTAASAESFGVGVRLDGVRVLVVDDDRDAVELISAILTAAPPPTR